MTSTYLVPVTRPDAGEMQGERYISCPQVSGQRIVTPVTNAEREHPVPEEHREGVSAQADCQGCTPREVKPEQRLE